MNVDQSAGLRRGDYSDLQRLIIFGQNVPPHFQTAIYADSVAKRLCIPEVKSALGPAASAFSATRPDSQGPLVCFTEGEALKGPFSYVSVILCVTGRLVLLVRPFAIIENSLWDNFLSMGCIAGCAGRGGSVKF